MTVTERSEQETRQAEVSRLLDPNGAGWNPEGPNVERTLREARDTETLGRVARVRAAAQADCVAYATVVEAERDALKAALKDAAGQIHESYHATSDGEDFTDCSDRQCIRYCRALGWTTEPQP